MVAIAVVSISLMLAIPSFTAWTRNSQIRTAAESMQNGIRFAQSEAVRRNAPVRFQLVTSTDNGCAVSTTGTSWVVNLNTSTTPAGGCGTVSDATSPYVLSKSPVVTSTSTTAMTATGSGVIAFDGLGRQIATTNPSTTPSVFTIKISSSALACWDTDKTNTNLARCLSVVVNPAGQIRVCDPGLTGTNVSC